MSWKIGMPNLGHTMEEGKLSEWLKAVGDTVKKGEVIALVESDKASFDIESPADGILASVDAEPGAMVLVGACIGVVTAPGEVLTPTALAPSGPGTQGSDARPALKAPVASAVQSGRGRISPAARALAEDLGVDWQQIVGTGDSGMVSRDDVRAYQASSAPGAASRSAIAQPGSTPLSAMRRAIAEATERSWRTIPHVALHSHADVSALQKADGPGLTASIVRACALALCEHPAFNGWLVGDQFTQLAQSDVALAIATPAGLVTAVVRRAETKSTAELGREIGTLAESARTGQLDGASMTGASFTVSSLGRWGVDAFAPIISAPQVAILGVGRVDRVAREGNAGTVRFASEIGLTLVFDHRANDGVQAAQMLASIVAYLEQPERLEIKP